MTTFGRNLGHVSRRRAERFGIPVDSFNPSKYFVVCLDYESRPPSTDELTLLRAYRDYLIGHFYTAEYRRKLMAMSLPAVGGHNTTIFKKIGRDAWQYRKLTWQIGPHYVPVEQSGEGAGWKPAGIPLPALLDRVESMGEPSNPPRFIQAYAAWRSLRPKLFPVPSPVPAP